MLLAHRHVREQRVVLEHHAEAALLGRQRVDAACSSCQICPPVSGSSPARQFSAVDLPQPDGPSRAMNSPRSMVRSRSVQGVLAAEAAADARRAAAARTPGATVTSSPSRRRPRGPTCRTRRPWPWRRAGPPSGCPRSSSSYSGRPNFCDRVLALLRRHREVDVLDRRARVEVAVVVGLGLLLRGEHELQQLQDRRPACRSTRPWG